MAKLHPSSTQDNGRIDCGDGIRRSHPTLYIERWGGAGRACPPQGHLGSRSGRSRHRRHRAAEPATQRSDSPALRHGARPGTERAARSPVRGRAVPPQGTGLDVAGCATDQLLRVAEGRPRPPRLGSDAPHQGGRLRARRQIERARERLGHYLRAEALRRHPQPLARRRHAWRLLGRRRVRRGRRHGSAGRGKRRSRIDPGSSLMLRGHWAETVARTHHHRPVRRLLVRRGVLLLRDTHRPRHGGISRRDDRRIAWRPVHTTHAFRALGCARDARAQATAHRLQHNPARRRPDRSGGGGRRAEGRIAAGAAGPLRRGKEHGARRRQRLEDIYRDDPGRKRGRIRLSHPFGRAAGDFRRTSSR